MVRFWADELDAVGFHHFGELGVLRKESVSRVNRVGIGDLCGGEDARFLQVAFRRGRRADADAFVSKAHGHGITVGLRVHDHRRDAHFLAGAVDAQGNLAAIGDKDFLDHVAVLTR